ncbi:hypothetical protein DEO72_LG5g1102 [Vigna unguiculata]|uniref:Uncharacterized protein n=1 Tax=Vigna unguiculata TaxID=3917 RepID=A0A4D6LXB2_VIGUN|nr:hypothetical protein DEO72_LG5g1102 [Vigna unguiculata]
MSILTLLQGLRNHEFSLQIGRKRTTTEITNKPVLAVVVAVRIVRQSQCLTVALRSPCTELFSRFWQPRGGQRRRGDQIGHVTVASRNNRIRGFLLLDGVRNGYIQILRARRRRSRDGEGKSRRRSVDAVCFAIKGRENGFNIGRRVEVRGSVGGVRVWKVLRRGEKGIGVCRGGDNRRRERVVVEKRRCVCGAEVRRRVALWFGGGVGGACSRNGWQRNRNNKNGFDLMFARGITKRVAKE